jgi:hypothetical protein
LTTLDCGLVNIYAYVAPCIGYLMLDLANGTAVDDSDVSLRRLPPTFVCSGIDITDMVSLLRDKACRGLAMGV